MIGNWSKESHDVEDSGPKSDSLDCVRRDGARPDGVWTRLHGRLCLRHDGTEYSWPRQWLQGRLPAGFSDSAGKLAHSIWGQEPSNRGSLPGSLISLRRSP